MNFVEVYCHKAEHAILINLDTVEYIVSMDDECGMYFGYNRGNLRVFCRSKDELKKMELMIADKVLKK